MLPAQVHSGRVSAMHRGVASRGPSVRHFPSMTPGIMGVQLECSQQRTLEVLSPGSSDVPERISGSVLPWSY